MTIQIDEINNSTQYATVWDGDKPVATMQRRRVYDKGPAWQVFDTKGNLMFSINTLILEVTARRIERFLKKQEA